MEPTITAEERELILELRKRGITPEDVRKIRGGPGYMKELTNAITVMGSTSPEARGEYATLGQGETFERNLTTLLNEVFFNRPHVVRICAKPNVFAALLNLLPLEKAAAIVMLYGLGREGCKYGVSEAASRLNQYPHTVKLARNELRSAYATLRDERGLCWPGSFSETIVSVLGIRYIATYHELSYCTEVELKELFEHNSNNSEAELSVLFAALRRDDITLPSSK